MKGAGYVRWFFEVQCLLVYMEGCSVLGVEMQGVRLVSCSGSSDCSRCGLGK